MDASFTRAMIEVFRRVLYLFSGGFVSGGDGHLSDFFVRRNERVFEYWVG